jgi:hypothetical protein
MTHHTAFDRPIRIAVWSTGTIGSIAIRATGQDRARNRHRCSRIVASCSGAPYIRS